MLKPVQLIRFDSKKNVQITQQAIDIFGKLQSKQLCIVCVAGKYRTGKSYILNRVILEKNSGFQVGPTINACTKGLWMWPQIVKIDYYGHVKECLIIDTEGLGSLEEGENTDLKIFLLAMLLSSYLIYNSVGSIDQKALQSLNLVISMAQLLQKQTNSYDSQQLINSFPHFMWLVRDFSLRLENQNGQTISSREYLESALSQKKGKSPAAERKNSIRRQLKSFFKERDCFTLIRPTLNEKDLQNLSTLSQKKLRPQFVVLINQLKHRIHHSIQPKKLRGKPLTPSGFIQLCQSYITSINSGKLPSISSSWDNLCIGESSRAIKSNQLIISNEEYQMRLKEYVTGKELKGETVQVGELSEVGEKLLVDAMGMVDRSFLGKLQKKLLKQKLEKTMSESIREVVNSQFGGVQQRVQKQVKQLIEQSTTITNDSLINDDQQQQHTSIRQYNIYHKLEQVRKLFSQFEKIISTRQLFHTNNSSYSITSQKHNQFIQRMYGEFMQHVVEGRVLGGIEEDVGALTQENKELKEKLVRVEQRGELCIKEDKSQILVLKEQLEEYQRTNKKLQLTNNKLQQQLSQLQAQNTTHLHQIQTLTTSLEQHHTQTTQHLLQQKTQLIKQSKQQLLQLQQQIYQLEQQNKLYTQQIHEMGVKERKINRQCEIYKQKFIEKQKEVEAVNKEMEGLRDVVGRLEREKRSLLRQQLQHSSSLQKTITFNTVNNNNNNQHQQQQQQSKQQQQIIYHHQQQQQLTHLLTRITHLQQQTQQLQQQLKNTTTLYQQQQSINSLLINTPQTINYQSLKKNYQNERKQSEMLKRKIKVYQESLSYVNKMECVGCGELVGKNSMLGKGVNGHYVKCVTSQMHGIQFDVSYAYDHQGKLTFLFQVRVQFKRSTRDSQQPHSLRRSLVIDHSDNIRQLKWQVSKSLQSIRLFLKTMKKDFNQISLFKQQQEESQQQQQSSSSMIGTSQENMVSEDKRINTNEQRRLYLDEQCHRMKAEIWRSNVLIEFFSIDLHLLRQTKMQRKRQQQQQLQLSPSTSTPQMQRQQRRKKLNLQLGEITQQPNDNDNPNSNPARKVLSQSLNFMKTAKFSMKKVFKFNSNL